MGMFLENDTWSLSDRIIVNKLGQAVSGLVPSRMTEQTLLLVKSAPEMKSMLHEAFRLIDMSRRGYDYKTESSEFLDELNNFLRTLECTKATAA